METVTIKLDTYNELRDFKNKISEGFTYRIDNKYNSRYITNDLTIKTLSIEYEKQIKEHQDKINSLYTSLNEKDKIIISLKEKLNKKTFSFNFWKRKKIILN